MEYQSAEELYEVLDKTVANLKANESFIQRIARSDMSIGFVVSDLGAEYSLNISKGEVSGSRGGADAATIGVTLNSDNLDRLLSGKLDGESAYMTGALRLRGSEWVAESALGYLYYIISAYKSATES